MPFQETSDGATHSYEDDCCFNHAQLDEYAIENLKTERQRLMGIIESEETWTREELRKMIMGNRK